MYTSSKLEIRDNQKRKKGRRKYRSFFMKAKDKGKIIMERMGNKMGNQREETKEEIETETNRMEANIKDFEEDLLSRCLCDWPCGE